MRQNNKVLAVGHKLTVVPISHRGAQETEIHLEKLMDMAHHDEVVGIAYVALRADGTSFAELAGRARTSPVAGHAMAVELVMQTRCKMMKRTRVGLMAIAIGLLSSLMPDGPSQMIAPVLALAEDDESSLSSCGVAPA